MKKYIKFNSILLFLRLILIILTFIAKYGSICGFDIGFCWSCGEIIGICFKDAWGWGVTFWMAFVSNILSSLANGWDKVRKVLVSKYLLQANFLMEEMVQHVLIQRVFFLISVVASHFFTCYCTWSYINRRIVNVILSKEAWVKLIDHISRRSSLDWFNSFSPNITDKKLVLRIQMKLLF